MLAGVLSVEIQYAVNFPTVARKEIFANLKRTLFGDFLAVEYPAKHSSDVGVCLELSRSGDLARVYEGTNDHPRKLWTDAVFSQSIQATKYFLGVSPLPYRAGVAIVLA